MTDNGPGIVRAQIPKIFAKLLYGSKFHRLRMSRGQQGIGISAAGMYGQLTTGTCHAHPVQDRRTARRRTRSRCRSTRAQNKPTILADEEIDWRPSFPPVMERRGAATPSTYQHGTCVSIEMEAAYVRGRLSVDEYLKQCAIVNPHLQLHYRIDAVEKPETGNRKKKPKRRDETALGPRLESVVRSRILFARGRQAAAEPPSEIKPHPHGVELGMLMQMLKDTDGAHAASRAVRRISRASATAPRWKSASARG